MKKFLLTFICLSVYVSVHAQGLDEILADIQDLEGSKDPKCYATASRLEDFMYGTLASQRLFLILPGIKKHAAKEVGGGRLEKSW